MTENRVSCHIDRFLQSARLLFHVRALGGQPLVYIFTVDDVLMEHVGLSFVFEIPSWVHLVSCMYI